MTRIFIGIVMITINLNAGVPGYFLPSLGLMLIYTRLRYYMRLGKSFVKAANFVLALMICEVLVIFVIATPLNLSDFVNSGIMIATTALQTCFFFYLMKGIQEEYHMRGDLEFKGSSVIGLVASKILLILFLIVDFKLGATICGLAILIFLVGIFRRLRQAERDLGLTSLTASAENVSSKALWSGYVVVAAIAAFGGMFFGSITPGGTMVQDVVSAAALENLVDKGMPEQVARNLSADDAESLADVTFFKEIRGDDSEDINVRLIAGMADRDEYKMVIWYGDLNGTDDSRYLSREIIEVSRTEPIRSCEGMVHYKKDGKVFSAKITASKVSMYEGKILIREVKEVETAETLYAEVSLRNGADHASGYLILGGRFGTKGVSSSLYTELFDANLVQFPYKNEKQTAMLYVEDSSKRSCTFVLPYRLQ